MLTKALRKLVCGQFSIYQVLAARSKISERNRNNDYLTTPNWWVAPLNVRKVSSVIYRGRAKKHEKSSTSKARKMSIVSFAFYYKDIRERYKHYRVQPSTLLCFMILVW